MLAKIVMKVMERPRKKETNTGRKFYSDCVDDKLLDMYSVSKNYV